MFLEQFHVSGLAHSSYLIGSNGVCAIIDPRRDVDIYSKEARKLGVSITHIIETHLHADFISGHLDLARLTGASIYAPKAAGVLYDHIPLQEGDTTYVGNLRFDIIETPGHTPEHISVIVSDIARGDMPWLVFTGDTLFVGDVGRPDLFGPDRTGELATKLHHSLQHKLAQLPDYVEVYPAHGAGSLCGRSMSNKRHSTLGYEKHFNHAFQFTSETEFIDALLRDMPPTPKYFHHVSEINRKGPRVLKELPEKVAVSPAQAQRLIKEGYTLLDVRTPEAFGGAHAVGAFNIWFSTMISTWAGWVLSYDQPILLLLENEEQWEEVVRQLLRVGLDKIAGYVDGGMETWVEAGLPISHIPQLSVHELGNMLTEKQDVLVLDVRTDSEYREGHITGAINIHAGQIKEHLHELERTKPIALVCRTAHRSSIAGSILQQHGVQHLYNVSGGMSAWVNAGYDVNMPGF